MDGVAGAAPSLVRLITLWWLNICHTRNTFCRTRSLSNATFSFLITWRSSSLRSAAVYIIGWFFAEIWRYINFKNGGRTPSWNCFTTIRYHPRSHCCSPQLHAFQISCQCDTQFWRYSYLNFSHICLEMPIQAPNGVFGDFGPLNAIIHHLDPKRHILA